MAEPTSIWREAKGVYQDAGRDNVPQGYVWDLIDYVPEILGAPVRQRGKWAFQSDALPNAIDGMIYANYKAGGKLLVANGTNLRDVPVASVGSTSVGTIPATLQDPVFHRDRVIIPAANGTSPAKYVVWNGAAYTLTDAPASAQTGKYAAVFKDRVLLAGSIAAPTSVGFSKPGDPTLAHDALSLIPTSLPLTGIAAQRNQILCFHAASVERIRGTIPPDSTLTDPTGDMVLDSLFDLAGCYDARSIALWNDNVIFADARGVHITDGAIVRNMAVQGGIETKWRRDFHEDTTRGPVLSLAGGVFRDLYIITIRSTSGLPITWVCDIPTRRFTRFGNVDSTAFALSVGTAEKIYSTDNTTKKVVDLSGAFNPDRTVVQTDGNGTNVLPVLETGWMRLGKQSAWRRVRDLFFGYETIENADTGGRVLQIDYLHSPADTTYETLGGFKHMADYLRAKLPFERRVMGFALKVTQLLPTRDTRIYDIDVWANPEEGHRT